MTTPHKNAALIEAWANGAKIQFLVKGEWKDCYQNNPDWGSSIEYRVKPPPSHKWQHLIDAQAAGKRCQMFFAGAWQDGEWYFTDEDHEYRLKPPTLKFRNFLWLYVNVIDTTSPRMVVSVCDEKDQAESPRESWSNFISWLGDWQEVEIPTT